MKTIIAGTRSITDYDIVKKAIEYVQAREDGWQITEVVSGHASGIDKLGERWAKENEIPIKLFPADWGQYGKAAGPIRNKLMAKYADCLIAIWDGKSRGTRNMITEAKALGLNVVDLYEKDLIDKGPIKKNPVFRGQKKVDNATNTITLNGASLTYHVDSKMNPPIVNFCVALYKEIKGEA